MAKASKHGEFAGFHCPKVAPRHYIFKDPSGAPSTFDRTEADQALETFLTPIPMEDAIENFVELREVAAADLDKKTRGTNWQTVIGFLARLKGVPPTLVPPLAAIALWGQMTVRSMDKGHQRTLN